MDRLPLEYSGRVIVVQCRPLEPVVYHCDALNGALATFTVLALACGAGRFLRVFDFEGNAMTHAATTIPYAGSHLGVCQLCHQRPSWKKLLYGHRVCKKCYYKFANRRQLAYLVDALLFGLIAFPLGWLIGVQLQGMVNSKLMFDLILAPISLLFSSLFIMKDGFNGQSPGRRLTDVQVLDEKSGRPISFGQSFKRNAILLVGAIPIIGGIASLIVIIIIAIQLNKGYRLGDRFARTRVIWKRYARSPVFGGDDLLCHFCGYDLTGNESGICPECGTARAEVGPTVAQVPGATQVTESRFLP
jgi:uncharacterized RDD family membrane protein YckC